MKIPITDKTINQFEIRLKELLEEGYPIEEAIKKAYQEFPVMENAREEIKDLLASEAISGYGASLPTAIVTNALVNMPWAPDGLILSERTTKGNKAILQIVKRVLIEQRRKGASYKKAALSLFDGYKKGGIIPKQEIPEFMTKLYRLSAGEGYRDISYRAELRRIQSQLNRMNSPSLRVAYHQLVKAIDTRNDEALQKAIYMATQERTRYFAERIARTELRRAYIDGFLAKYDNDPTVVAYKWRMSSAHPVFDICDVYANADLYGLGKGVYPKDKVPLLPAHPHCLCYLMPVRDLKGKVETERIEQGGREYLDKLSTRQRQRLLGIHGEKDVKAGVSWTAKLRGYSGNVLEGRIAIVPDVLKPYVKDGKINIEDFGKRTTGETDESFKNRIWGYIKSDYCTKDFTPRQEIHYKFSKKYIEGKSYYEEPLDLLKCIDAIMNGELVVSEKGIWTKKVRITHDFEGVCVTKTKGDVKTKKSMVHFSNKGMHLVPRE